MIIIFAQKIANMIIADITQVTTKFGSLKIDNCGNTMMCFDDNVYICTMIMDCIRNHHCISIVINFEATKFCGNLIQDPILLNINFNHIFYLI